MQEIQLDPNTALMNRASCMHLASKLVNQAENTNKPSENTAKNQKYKCLETAKKNLKELQQNSTLI